MKVDAIATHFAGAHLQHQEEIKLLESFWHAWQKSAFLPPLGRYKETLYADAAMVRFQKECLEEFFEALR